MKKSTLILLLLCALSPLSAHPLHVSILNIMVSDGKISMVMKTFVDDWETAYFHYHSKPLDLTKQENYSGEWFRDYLTSSLRISKEEGSGELMIRTDSVWFEELSMTIEMHADYTGKLNSLYIYNALLIDIFPDQSNLTILSYDRKEKGIKFDYRKREELLKLR